MKQVKTLLWMSISAGLLLFSACKSKSDKKSDENKSDTTAAKTETTGLSESSAPVGRMIVRHKVADFSKWIPGYEAGDSLRLAHGLHSYVLGRGVEDSNMVMIAMSMDDLAKAKSFAEDPALKEAMKKHGVTGAPDFDYIQAVLNDTTALQATIRVMVRHKVKDWDTFKKTFDSHKQARIDAGLTDRVIAYTIGDNHNVTLVFAVSDMTRAKAFIDSKDLKDKMAEAGVEGPPSFFFYRIVKKY